MAECKFHWLHKQGSGRLNEDAYFLGPRICGVFDGATALNGDRYENGKTGGYLAAQLACDVFRTNNAPLLKLTDQANREIFQAMQDKGVDLARKEDLWSTSFAVVRVGTDSFEWVQSGDSLILAIDHDHSYRVLVPDHAHDTETLCMWRDMAARGTPRIFETLKEQIIAVRRQMNVTYGVLNGEPQALDFISRGRANLRGIKHILLFTDGLFIPKEDPTADHRFDILVQRYLDGGLDAVYQHVHKLQAADPLCHKYPRFKPHDDIAAVAISMTA
ncbi:protein phosphatase 2C domain-containing protein [Desulfosarcina ovata]|uniref:protein phosphatase 2C domain-containing protein n=1 Tax=Desulfosarcina ovata TaxID=83564 RepID=UPI0012D2B434|nr:protein phosphatase 2C domain-containing protein [Desulfosarcina ovata]